MATSPLQRLLKNITTLLSGNVAGAILGFFSALVSARVLGPEDLGRIVLVQAFVLGIDKLVNFQSWRAIIKYGAEAMEREDPRGLAQVLKFGLVVDLASAALGACIAAVGSLFVGRWLGWEPTLHAMAWIYATTLLFNVTGAPIAILRLFDRFRLFAVQRLLVGGVKLLLVVVAALLEAPAWGFLLAWIVADAVGFLSLVAMGWWVYHGQRRPAVWPVPLRGIRAKHPGILSFVLVTNASTALRLATREVDVFVVGAWLGDAAVGLYKVARQFAQLAAQVYDPLSHAVYPELAKHVARGDRSRFLRTVAFGGALATVVAAVAWLATWAFGEWAIVRSVGEAFRDASPILVAYVVAVCINVATFFLGPCALALGRPNATLHGIIAASVVYFASLIPLMNAAGAVGAGWAQVVFSAVLAAWMVVEVIIAFRRWDAASTTSDTAEEG